MPHTLELDTLADYFRARFSAMASPCELLIAGVSAEHAREAAECCAAEAWRIEEKYSRYRQDNVIHALHQSLGQALCVDEETADLLDFAALCFELSAGRFDITSGVLRQAWTFDGSDKLPSPAKVQSCLAHIGWDKVQWQRPWIRLPAGMEIDLGGIGKEYAVDRAFLAVQQRFPQAAVLVNFGGDLHAGRAPDGQTSWQIGIEDPRGGDLPLRQLAIHDGALATSGDARRFILHHGKRYGHILDPRTGYPVENAPRSITVAASQCTQAGLLATLAMLHGADAETFLEQQQVRYWSIR